MEPPITDEAVEAAARAIAGIALEEQFEGDAESEWGRVEPYARAALEAAIPHLSEAALFDRGKMVKPKPGAPSGGYGGTEAEMIAAQAKSFAENDAANRGPRHAMPDAAEELEVVAHLRLGATQLYKGLFPGTAEPLVRQSDALAIIEKLRAENYLLRNERDNLGDNLHESETRSEARLAEAVEVLTPFAEVLTRYSFTEHQLVLLSEDNPKGRRLAHLRPEDFGAATTFLQSLGKEASND